MMFIEKISGCYGLEKTKAAEFVQYHGMKPLWEWN